MTVEQPSPALLLLPNLIGEHRSHSAYFPTSVDEAVASLDGLIAESLQGGRSYLNQFRTKKPPYQIPLALLNEHTAPDEIDFFLKPIKDGQRWGLISDCGLPCMADPGSKLVFRARQLGISIEAFPGPSSIFMALMLSGLPGQRFSFHGYLDRNPEKLRQQLRSLEKTSMEFNATQIFMEAPYRNGHTLKALCETVQDSTMVCVAWDLTMPSQGIVCHKNSAFKKSPLPQIDKKPAIFLLYAGNPL
jgi:16S rRNA (cytidine1402-2'-O)-methyltransferase